MGALHGKDYYKLLFSFPEASDVEKVALVPLDEGLYHINWQTVKPDTHCINQENIRRMSQMVDSNPPPF